MVTRAKFLVSLRADTSYTDRRKANRAIAAIFRAAGVRYSRKQWDAVQRVFHNNGKAAAKAAVARMA